MTPDELDDDSKLIATVRKRIEAMPDKTIITIYRNYGMSGAVSLSEKRSQIVTHEVFLAQMLKKARSTLGLTQYQMATVLGYEGKQRKQMCYDLETGRRPIREPQRRLVEQYLIAHQCGCLPDSWPE